MRNRKFNLLVIFLMTALLSLFIALDCYDTGKGSEPVAHSLVLK
jgi:hypothetical protein